MPPYRYLHTGNMWRGEPVNQYGFGVYKANPYQKGYGAYSARRRRQKGYGLGSMLMSLGRRIVPRLLPLAKRVAKGAAKQGLKALPGLIAGQNRKTAAKNLVKNIGQQALGQAVGAISRPRGKNGEEKVQQACYTRGAVQQAPPP